MSKRWALAAALVVAAGLLPASATADTVALTAGFDRRARLGGTTALQVGTRIDPAVVRSPPAEVRLLYPKSLGLFSSGLGLATCRRSASEFEQVLIDGSRRSGCPANAVIGYGSVRGEVRLGSTELIPEIGAVTLLAGPVARERLGLVALVPGQHPFGAQLAYAGDVGPATAPFGGELTFRLHQIPSLAGYAEIALTDLDFSIGSPRITYYDRSRGRSVPFKPDTIPLPDACPRGGFPFRTRITFEDGTSAAAGTTVRCPRAPAGR